MHWIRAAAALGLSLAAFSLAAQTPQSQPGPQPRFVVVLDAAHGGDDIGSHLSDGSYEKTVTLAFAVRLRSLLAARGFQVVMTRDSDASLTPEQRATVANRANALACLSLHAAETGSGVHLFASNLTPVQAARFMPWKTAQAGWLNRSLALTGALNSALQHGGSPVTLGRTALPGIDSMTCPAVAIELAPERNSDKKIAAEPSDADYQARVAAQLAAALLEWRTEQANPGARQP